VKLGVCEWVLRAKSDAEVFASARAAGFAGVEINPRNEELRAATAPRLEALKALSAQHGVAVCSLSLGEHNGNGLVAAPWRKDEPAREIRAALDWCQALGARALLVPFFFANEPRNRLQRDALADALAPLCRHAAARGVTLAFEGTLAARDLQALAQRIDSPAFGVYFDLANVVWLEMDGPAEIRALGSLIARVHMKDSRIGPGDCPLGAGRVDFAASIRALHDIGYDDWVVSESGGNLEQLAADVAFTKKVFADQGYPAFEGM
jgi:sugar phosphate isomerase/epimerase